MKKLLYAYLGLFFLVVIFLLTACNNEPSYAPGDTSVVQKDSVDYNIEPDSTVKRRGPGSDNKLN